jgi:PKD repeat protein
MATPLVAAGAALVWADLYQSNNGLPGPSECTVSGMPCNRVVRSRLENGADKVGAQGQNLLQWTRHGRLNIAHALGNVEDDAAPTAAFTYTCNTLNCLFDGSISSDDKGITGFVWDFGDGSSPGSGSTVSHAYSAAGTYAVTLTARDAADQTDTASATVQVRKKGKTSGGSGGGGSGGNCPPGKAAQGKC